VHPVFKLSRERGRWNGDLCVADKVPSYLRNEDICAPIGSESTWILCAHFQASSTVRGSEAELLEPSLYVVVG